MFLRVCVGIIVFGLYLKMTRDLLDKRLKRGQKRRMSTFSTILSSDHGSFHSQSQITPTTIFAQAYFESSEFPTRESLIDFCILQLSQHYRFASYVEREQTGSYFVSCRIDPLHHIKSDTLPDEASVPDYIESQFNRTWTQEIRDKRPLWYIHRLETAKGRCCILFEVHHCLGDGLSMMDLFQDIVTNKSGKPVKVNLEKFMKPAKSMAFNEKVLSTGLTSLYASVSVGKVLLQSFIWPDAPSLIHPKEFKTPKAHKMHSLKPMSLAHIKAIKNKHKTTVNDVVASLIAGGLHKMLIKHGQEIGQTRALIPFSFPRQQLPFDVMTNHWTLTSLPLAVEDSDPVKRLLNQQTKSQWFKKSLEPLVSFVLHRLTYTLFGSEFSGKVSYDLVSKHTLLFTNVPGFEEQVYFCGKPVDQFQPVLSNLIPQVSVVSYNGSIYGTIVVDAAYPDVSEWIECIHEEYQTLCHS